MIAKMFRFHGHSSLNYVYRKGASVRGPMCAIKYIHNPRRTRYRAAIVVSKKVHKNAVVRNRIRRRCYEIIRNLLDQSTEPYDIVVTIFSDTIASLPQSELELMITAQLKQAGILQNKTNNKVA